MIFERIKSVVLDNERNIAVYLPPHYKESSEKKYPVLYMHDGQNLFTEIAEGSCTKWRVKETADRHINDNRIEDIIIVGIYNSPDRISEYTPSYMEKYNAGGKGKEYTRFIVEELKPYIDKNYRTLSDRENTAVAGSSLGGLISFYIAWNYPEIFEKVGAISPSFWWDNCSIIKEVENYSGQKKDLNIWIDAGDAEEENDRNNNGIIDMVDDARDMVAVLKEKGFITNKDVVYREVEGGKHNEEAWAKRLNQVFLYMFGKVKGSKLKGL
jgi:predicted alpha/beta superfamily hydrolase